MLGLLPAWLQCFLLPLFPSPSPPPLALLVAARATFVHVRTNYAMRRSLDVSHGVVSLAKEANQLVFQAHRCATTPKMATGVKRPMGFPYKDKQNTRDRLLPLGRHICQFERQRQRLSLWELWELGAKGQERACDNILNANMHLLKARRTSPSTLCPLLP